MTNEIKLAFSHPVERSRSNFSATELDRISLRDHIVEVEIGAFQSERGTTQRICFNVVFLVASSTRFSNAATRNTAKPHAAAWQSFFLNFDAKPTLTISRVHSSTEYVLALKCG